MEPSFEECTHWEWDGQRVTCFHPTEEDITGSGSTMQEAYETMLKWLRWQEEECCSNCGKDIEWNDDYTGEIEGPLLCFTCERLRDESRQSQGDLETD